MANRSFKNHSHGSLMIATMSLWLIACGAPTKSASEVSTIFEQSGTQLSTKMDNLCAELQGRSQAPNLQAGGISRDECKDSGEFAIDFQTADQFHIMGLENQKFDDDVTPVGIRTQVWLGKSLLDLVSLLGGKLKAGNDGGLAAFSGGGNAGPTEGIGDIKADLKNFNFDSQSFELSGELAFEMDGAVSIKNEISIDGKLLNGNFVATASTTSDASEEDSLLRSLKATIFVVPHATDVYIELYVNLEVFKLGLIDGLIEGLLQKLVGGSLKNLLNSTLG